MFQLPDFSLAVPEIFVLSMACLILVIDLFLSDRHRPVTYLLSQATLAGTAILVLGLYSPEVRHTFGGSFVLDPMAIWLKVFICLVAAVVFLYSQEYLRQRQLFTGEYFVLGLFAVLGMMVMVSAHSFLTIYLGLELLALCLYAMVALQRDSIPATEAAMKFFVLGALASGLLLYGMSMFYGVTGSLDITEIGQWLTANQGQLLQNKTLVFGIVFVVVGVAFKLGAVPFHMWVPDVYQGAPTSVTMFISTVPKIAAFAMVVRLLVDGFGGLHMQWRDMLIILAIASMGVGNIVAIAQTNLKRMLAYSTIAHMGFLLLGILAGTKEGIAASMFYTLVYALMGVGAFGMIILLSRAGFEAENLDDFKGLNDRSPWYALVMAILMISMAGVPILIGFWAKFAVLQALVNADLLWLAVLAVLFSVIGAYYYLRVVILMYVNKAEADVPPLEANRSLRILLSANGAAVLLLGVFPNTLMAVCLSAIGP